MSRQIAPLDFQKVVVSAVYGGNKPMPTMTFGVSEKWLHTCKRDFKSRIRIRANA